MIQNTVRQVPVRRWFLVDAGLRLAVGLCCCLLSPAWLHGLPRQDEASDAERPTFTAEQIEFFESKVRPLLVQYCYECHDPANGEPGGSLSLASRSDIVAGGDSGPAIDLIDPSQSLLIEAVRHGPRFQMPPDQKIPSEDVATLMTWIEQKAPWPAELDQRSHATDAFDLEQRRDSHWAWQAPVRSPEPETKETTWPNSALDRYIWQRLAANGLRPAPSADGLTWLRRVHLDLTGLPPTAEQAQQFQTAWKQAAQESSPDTLAEPIAIRDLKQATVDQLLAQPTFGEHWARHWLDLVRYAETCGHEFDFPLPGAFEYRDYVIRSLNQDVPYDQWVLEHLAGDLLEQPRRNPESGFNESVLGTMFWYLHEATHAPVDVRGDQAGRVDNQIDVFGKTFLGLTVACARCHDHKFDAISARDYYALFGIVKGARRDVAVIDTDRAHERFVQQQRELQLTAAGLMQLEWEAIAKWIADPESDFTATLTQYVSDPATSKSWPLTPTSSTHPLYFIQSYLHRPDGQSLPDWWRGFREQIISQQAAADQFRTQATPLADFAASGHVGWWKSGWAFADDSTDWRPQFIGRDAADSARWLAGPLDVADSEQWSKPLAGTLRSPTFTLAADRLHIRGRGENAKLRLIIDGYQMHIHQDLLFSQTVMAMNSPDFTWFTMQGDLNKYVGHEVYLELIDEGEGSFAVTEIWQGGEQPTVAPHPAIVDWCKSHEQLTGIESLVEQAATWMKSEANEVRTTDAERRRWRTFAYQWSCQADHSSHDLDLKWTEAHWRELHQRAQALAVPAVGNRKVYVATASEGVDHALYIRGNPKNPGPLVPRGNLEALQLSMASDLANSSPTSVSVVGTNAESSGRLALAQAIASPNNPLTARVMVNRIWLHLFGEGLVPTPDDFGFNGTSPTHPELLDHLALEFMSQGWSIKKLIREMVLSRTYGQSTVVDPVAMERDPGNLLYHSARVRRASGEVLRDSMLQISGRLNRQSYGPSVPAYVSELMQGRGRPNSGPLDGQGRRSVYLEVRRNFLNPWMLVFDTPAPFSTMGKRSRSNVPAQALALMNDPLVHELAHAWAQQVLNHPGEDLWRLEHMFWSALGRPMTPQEQTVMVQFLQSSSDSSPAAKQEAWTQMAHALFNLKEFAFVN